MNKKIDLLTNQETLIMKAIWDYGEDIPMLTLLDNLKEDLGLNYARTTVATFLLKLSSKKFVQTYRVGRCSFIQPLVTLDEYRLFVFEKLISFWYNGSIEETLRDISTCEAIDQEEREKAIKLLGALATK